MKRFLSNSSSKNGFRCSDERNLRKTLEPVNFYRLRHRSGIEGTISQGVRVCDLRRPRYIGLDKTHLQHLLTAMAINITRVIHWLAGKQPAQARSSAFVRLHAAALAV
jgi:transposase